MSENYIVINGKRTELTEERAIEEVVKPFMKEHPDFVW